MRNKNPEEIIEMMDAVDVLTLACRSDPVSAKDVDDQYAFSELGYYGGALRMTDSFKHTMITVPIENDRNRIIGTQKVCQWAYIPINESRVSNYFDRKEQNFRVHGHAHCKNAVGRKFEPWQDYGEHPMIAIRTYPTAETALTNCMYYHKYGEHRCNLALDKDLDVGVYAHIDAEIISNGLAGAEPATADTVLGVVAGYLHKAQKKKGLKISLDPRSCKLLSLIHI